MLKRLYARLANLNKKGGERGFTLVELMIVIAVIAILALVLVPKAGVLKNKAKESGLKINMSLMEAEVESVIDNYTVDSGDIGDLETRIATDVNNALETTDTSQKLRNPFTGVTGCIEKANVASGGAVIYLEGTDNDGSGIVNPSNWPGQQEVAADPDLKGMIAFGAYPNITTGKVEVMLMPYDSAGNLITGMVKVISQ